MIGCYKKNNENYPKQAFRGINKGIREYRKPETQIKI